MSVIGVMVSDVFASFGRTLCRGALVVDPSSYSTGFLDGSNYGFGQGWSTGYSFGYTDGGDDEAPIPVNVPIGGATVDNFGAGFATGYPFAVDLDEAEDAGFARGLSEGLARASVGGGGGSGDTTAPLVNAVSPTPDTPPGAAGGMPSAYGSAAVTPIVFTVTDVDGADDLELVQVSALFLSGASEVVYRDGGFAAGYVAGSSAPPVGTGLTFTVARGAGWPAAARSGDLAVSLAVDAVDAAGNLTTTVLRYQMPARTATVPAAAAVVSDGAVDLFSVTQALIVTQLKA